MAASMKKLMKVMSVGQRFVCLSPSPATRYYTVIQLSFNVVLYISTYDSFLNTYEVTTRYLLWHFAEQSASSVAHTC